MKQVRCFLITILYLNLTSAQEPFIVKPYLQIGQNPTPQSLQVLWHAADHDTVWSVEHRIGTKGEWVNTPLLTSTRVAVSGIEAHRVYHAALAGLVPGTNFTYRILKEGKTVFTSDAIAPKDAGQPYRFVAFGDIGTETADQKKLATQAYLSKPDFVVVPGDIVYENGRISEYRSKFWPVYNGDKSDTSGAPIMRSVPFIAAVGNHDADSRNLDKIPDALAYYMFWDQPLNGPLGQEGGAIVPELKGSDENKKAFLHAAGDTYPRMTNYSFDYGNSHWTVLDADSYVDWTDKELTDWVAKDLSASKNATWHFVMFHQPGFNSSIEHYEEQQMRLLAPVFEAGHVDVVFNGHVHNYQRSFPLHFMPQNKGTLLVGGKENKKIQGRVVNGKWTLDKIFDGKTHTIPNGVIYLITGAGVKYLYNPEKEKDPDTWQKFTDKFISTVHSMTLAEVNGKTLFIRQISAEGKELDAFKITRN